MTESRLTRFQTITLVAMRMVIGWHFLYEGLAKWLKGNWSAYSFLMESKWIFSGFFRWLATTPSVLAVVNTLNIWGLILIGLGLILGLFTRTAAGAGILLIMLYYFCNPPFVGLFYSIPVEGNNLIVNKNIIELAGLLVLIAMPTGNVAGLGHLLKKILRKN
jgi:thiosulfate dehydrogenase (quinone) large subunit